MNAHACTSSLACSAETNETMSVQILLLAACCFAPSVLGIIHNLDRQQEDELIQPLEVDISPDDDLGYVAENLLGPDFASRRRGGRQADDGSGEPGVDIGTVTRLNDTDRHFFALVHWTGHPSEVLFIVTMTRRNNPTDSILWRSTDYGKTFSNDNYKFNDSNAVIQWYYVSPMENNLIMADARQGKIFVTRDEGVSFVGHTLPFTPNRLSFQSQRTPNVLEGTIPEHVIGYDQTSQELYVSKDLGDTWIKLGNNVSRYNWRVLDEQYEAPTALYYEMDINDTHAMLMVTQDSYNESRPFDPTLGPIAINTTILSNEYILVQKPVNWSVEGEYNSPLWVSTFRRPFRQANFPLQIQEEHYAVMDASQNQIFLAVQHAENETVNLYISDREGVDYSLSLNDVSTVDDWTVQRPNFDIHVVSGMPSTFVVNRYKRVEDESGPPVVYKTTLISYDKGAQWSILNAPAVDANNQPTLCLPPLCSLHLRMDTDTALRYTSILSRTSAIGLIIAQGNIGSHLEDDLSRLRVYLSRDGGFFWQEIESGHWSFQMVALGSIIVMVPKRPTVDPVDYLLWSCDEGITWTRYVFSLIPMRFIGLLPERGQKARHVTLFGYYLRRPFAWLIVDLDFSEAVPVQCSYPDDYFEWTPSDGRSTGRCVLGASLVYERRNSSACCHIDPEYERPISNTTCTCTWQDYTCDVGYEKLTLSGPCVPTNGQLPTPDSCTEGGTYQVPSGYRKVVGDVCIEPSPSPFDILNVSCPPEPPGALRIVITDDISEGIAVGQILNFSLVQTMGWTMSTLYEWDFDDNYTVSGVGLENYKRVSHAFTTDGLYTVSVRASNDAGSSSVYRTLAIGVVAPVGLNITVSGDLSEPGNILTFTLTQQKGLTDVTQYHWDFGDGNITTGMGLLEYGVQTHVYNKIGVYTVRVIAFNDQGANFMSLKIKVGILAPVGINITVSGDFSEAGNILTFNLTQEKGLTDVTQYQWDFGDGNITTGMGLLEYGVQTHVYKKIGVYTVEVVASNDHGRTSKSLKIKVGTLVPMGLSITVSGDLSEAGNMLNFTLTQEKGLTDVTQYQWDFGDGVNVTGMGLPEYGVQTHMYNKIGVYTVEVIASNDHGTNFISLKIKVGTLAPVGLNITVSGDLSEAGNNLIFTLTQEKGLTDVTQYQWDFGDGNITTGMGLPEYRVQTHMYNKIGVYTVEVVASNDHGRTSKSLKIKVGILAPVGLNITVSGDLSNAGNILTFTLTQQKGLTDVTQYQWDFGDGNITTGMGLLEYGVQTYMYNKIGVYTVEVVASNDNGRTSKSLKIKVGTLAPVGLNITVSGDLSDAGNNLTFTLTQEKGLTDVTRYQWDFGDGVNVTGMGLPEYGVQTHMYEEIGVYTVKVIASNDHGTNSMSLKIKVGTLSPVGLNIVVSGDLSEAGNILTFNLTQEKGLTDVTQYKWDFGDGVSVTGMGLLKYGVQRHKYKENGNYTVEVLAFNEYGKSSTSLKIYVGIKTGATEKTVNDEESKEVGLGVGIVLAVIILAVVVALLVGVVWWYHKRYRSLEVRYRSLQQGTVPMTLSEGEFQEDFGYSKDDIDDSDVKGLVNDKDELQ